MGVVSEQDNAEGYTPTREDVLVAIQEKRRGGWSPESIPGRNGDVEGQRALKQIEHDAVSVFLRSDDTLDRVAKVIAEQRFRVRGIPLERLTPEDIFFCKIEAEAVLKTLEEVME